MKQDSPVFAQADQLLAELATATWQLSATTALAERELNFVREKHSTGIRKAKARLEDLEKQVTALARKHRGAFFDGQDRVELPHGALFHTMRQVVRKAKAVTVAKLEELGFLDGVRTEKKVDWDALNKWPDERLIVVGTERKDKEEFGYELKGTKGVNP